MGSTYSIVVFPFDHSIRSIFALKIEKATKSIYYFLQGVSSRTCRRPRVLRPKTCLPTIMNHSSAALYQQQQNPSGSSHSFGPPAGVFDGTKGEQFEIIDGSAGSSENGECRLKRQNSPASIPLQQQQSGGMSSPFEAFEHRLIDAVAKNVNQIQLSRLK